MKINPLAYFLIALLITFTLVITYKIKNDPFKSANTHQHNEPSANQVAESDMVDHNFQDIIGIYADNCMRCHGKTGEGTAMGPQINNTALNSDQIKNLIIKGKGEMPAFPDFTEQQLKRLVELVRHL